MRSHLSSILEKILQFRTVAHKNSIALRSRFKMIFDFYFDDDIKQSQTMYVNPANIFEEILVFSATTSTKKNGSEATLGTLGAEKLKFTKKN